MRCTKLSSANPVRCIKLPPPNLPLAMQQRYQYKGMGSAFRHVSALRGLKPQ